MKRIALLLVAAAVLTPSAAARAGGCWATVGLSSLPKGLHAGDAWSVRITVKQHGFRPLADARPRVTITSAAGRKTVVRAVRTARTGVYRARVVFPSAGRWTYTVYDGFEPHCGREHTFAPVTVLP